MLDNFGVKLLCLLVAIVLWVQVAGNLEVEEYVELPVRTVGLPDSLVVRDESLPDKVGVLVEGSRLQLLLDDVVRRDAGYVELDLGETFAGLFETRLSPLDVRSNGRPVSIVSPASVSFMIYHRAEKRVPVRLSVEGQLPQGFTMVGRPEISPPEVQVSGPSTLVEHLDHVTTEPLRLSRRRQGFVDRLGLAMPDTDIRLRPVEVEVAVAVDEIIERAFANVPLSILADADPSRLHVDPTVAQVRVLGAAAVINALGPEDVSLVLHIGELEAGVYQLEPEVVVPDGVISSSVDPSSFQVIVGDPKSKDEP